MYDMDSVERCVPLDSVDANVLRKWGSAWLDLTHAGQALETRRNTPVNLSTIFVRRALWEAAVISYGRIGQSTQARKIDLYALFAACGDPGASDLHDEIKKWRHGHVAHRSDSMFESVDALVSINDMARPSAMRLVIESSIGPQDDEQLTENFHQHVDRLRNTIWQSFMVPLVTKIIEKSQRRPDLLGDTMPYPTPSAERMVATLTLWTINENAQNP
ncbi:hypothetical protein [Nocardia rhamnosiphila]